MRPVNIVSCTLSMGTGNGISRMDEALARSVDRGRFRYTCCFTDISHPDTIRVPDWCVAVPAARRFERLCALFREADIVQFNGGFDPVACEAAAATGVPTLIEIMHQCDRGQRSPAIDVTVCVSEAVRAVQPFPERTEVIHNGIDTDLFRPAAPRPRDRTILLEVAQRGKAVHFHLDELAEPLLAVAPGIELLLAGSGQTGPDAHQGRVRFLGLRRDMPDLYAKAHFLVLASKQDAFGLACAEAMACGCLPIVSADGGMAEIVTHGRTGWLFDPRDRQGFLDLVRRAVAGESADGLETMRRQARAAILEQYSLGRCIDRYERLYLECAARNGLRQAPAAGPWLRRSAEGLIGETIMAAQARLDLEAIVAPWLDTLDLPLSPLGEPDDAYWRVCRTMLLSLFAEIARAGYQPLADALTARLERLFPLHS